MGRQGRRVRLAPGVYRDAKGIAGVVTAGPHRVEQRFPKKASIRSVQNWREDARVRLRKLPAPTRATGTFADDVARYMRRSRTTLERPNSRESDLQPWLAVFKDRRRRSITEDDVNEQLWTWRESKAASTCNHRRTALSQLYVVLDGKRAQNPARDAVRFSEPKAQPRGLPREHVLAVLEQVTGPRTKPRLLVLHWTGLRPSQLMRMGRDDVDLERGVCYAPAGKGGDHLALPLSDSGIAAWRLYIEEVCWGSWSCPSANKALRRAANQAGREPFTVYVLRHSYATALRRLGADLSDVQELLGHRDPRTTKRYAPVVSEKLIAAVERLEVDSSGHGAQAGQDPQERHREGDTGGKKGISRNTWHHFLARRDAFS